MDGVVSQFYLLPTDQPPALNLPGLSHLVMQRVSLSNPNSCSSCAITPRHTQVFALKTALNQV